MSAAAGREDASAPAMHAVNARTRQPVRRMRSMEVNTPAFPPGSAAIRPARGDWVIAARDESRCPYFPLRAVFFAVARRAAFGLPADFGDRGAGFAARACFAREIGRAHV